MRRRVNRLMGGGRIVYFDSLAGTDGESVLDRAGESGGTFQVTSTSGVASAVFDTGRLKASPTLNAGGSLFSGGRLRRRNGRVSVDVIRVAANQATAVGVLARVRGAKLGAMSGPFYDIPFNNQSNVWQFVRSNATVVAVQVSQTLTQDQVYRLELDFRGNRFLVYVDGVLIKDFEDVQTIRGYHSGIFLQNSLATASSMRLANWRVTR